jgi:hypothetical protein
MMSDPIERKIILPRRGKKYRNDIINFANRILELNEKIGFKVSSRGWAYLLESYNLINKGEFDRIQKLINKCRKRGLLPIDFVAEDDARRFSHVWRPTEETPVQCLKDNIEITLDAGHFHKPDYWNGEEYYIQMLVEKIDLVTLFSPVCEKYHVPLASSRGWSSILQRAEIIERFKEMEEIGHKCVLLYAGDHDPAGLAISDFLRVNLKDLKKATGWNPDNLIIDRFGLNYDFIMQYNLTWIDNLITGSGKQPDRTKPYVAEYIEQFGERKVEANAIVVKPVEARQLCEDAITKYLGTDVLQRFEDKKQEILDKYSDLLKKVDIQTPLQKALDLLEEVRFENHDSKTKIPPHTHHSTSFPPQKASIKFLAKPGIIVGDLVNEKDDVIGYAAEDGYLYDQYNTIIGYYKEDGECYFYTFDDD